MQIFSRTLTAACCSVALFLTGPGGFVSAATAEEPSGPAAYQAVIGEPHADFLLPRIDDHKPLRLSDYRGKKVLLVHFASW